MPIRPENKHRYPPNWSSEIVPRIARRAGGQCECNGECGWHRCPTREPGVSRCTARHHEPHPVTDSWVVLTTAHRNHQPEDVRDSNLAHWCQGCHLVYDAHIHRANRRKTREQKLGLVPLWTEE